MSRCMKENVSSTNLIDADADANTDVDADVDVHSRPL